MRADFCIQCHIIIIITSTKFNKLVVVTKDRPTKDHAYKMDPSKVERQFKWKPKYTITEGLKKTAEWNKDNKKQLSRMRNVYVHKA